MNRNSMLHKNSLAYKLCIPIFQQSLYEFYDNIVLHFFILYKLKLIFINL